jgi:arginyl-tRNA synthetase
VWCGSWQALPAAPTSDASARPPVIPGDLSGQLARVLGSLAAAGALPPAATTLTAHGTWRPAQRAGPGSYASSLPFELARLGSRPPQVIAAQLAQPLAVLPWIERTLATRGYLTVTVTTSHLAGLPARIVAAGPASARSHALSGRSLTAPYPPDLTAEISWPRAWKAQRDALVGRFGHAAGADVLFIHSENLASGPSPPIARSASPAAAVAYYGADAVRYALARTPGPRASAIEAQLSRPLDLSNPFCLVRYAHAGAASTLRWAAGLGLADPSQQAGSTAELQPSELQPAELELVYAMSWLAERVAAACRRSRPAELARYLEDLAAAWLASAERHPALPFGGRGAPAEPAGAIAMARLELAAAVRETLAAGLGLLTVAAPAMM